MQLNMKNIIIAVLATLSCLSAIGQQGQRPQYFDDYLFPRYMKSGCYDTSDLIFNYSYFGGLDNSFMDGLKTTIAQPFFIDSTITVRGIGAIVHRGISDSVIIPENLYMQIRDGSLNNVLAEIRYDTMHPKFYQFIVDPQYPSTGIRYIEALFNQTVHITDTIFYITITFLEGLSSANNPIQFSSANGYGADCSNGDFPILIGGREGGWVPIIEPFTENDILARNDSLILPYEILVFPILGKVSSLSEIDIDDKVEVYPNPSSKEININSQYILNSIEILNTLGQRVYREKINTTNKTIDISALNKGIYIIELKTEKGIIHRKFIKE